MDRDLLAFLRSPRFGVVSSIAADGRPQSAVVGIVATDCGELVFDTLGTSNKAQNLRRDPRVSVVVWAGGRTVQLEGAADEPVGADRERLLAVYLAAFPDGVARLAEEHIIHVRITPLWARDSDFDVLPPQIRAYDLNA